MVQAAARATMGVTAQRAGSRVAGLTLEGEWDAVGMRGRWTMDGGDEHEGLWQWVTGAETGGRTDGDRLSCSAVVARHSRHGNHQR